MLWGKKTQSAERNVFKLETQYLFISKYVIISGNANGRDIYGRLPFNGRLQGEVRQKISQIFIG